MLVLFFHGMWDLPGSGIKPAYSALVGGFFTTEPQGSLINTILKAIYEGVIGFLGQLKLQKCILSQFQRVKSKTQVLAGPCSL